MDLTKASISLFESSDMQVSHCAFSPDSTVCALQFFNKYLNGVDAKVPNKFALELSTVGEIVDPLLPKTAEPPNRCEGEYSPVGEKVIPT